MSTSGAKSEVAEKSPRSGFRRSKTSTVLDIVIAISLISDASRGLSITILAPISIAFLIIDSSLIDPFTDIRSGGTPARSAPSNSPGPNTSQPQPNSVNSARTPKMGQALSDGISSKCRHSASNADLKSSTRCRIASPENTNTGVPNSRATASSSIPPIRAHPLSSATIIVYTAFIRTKGEAPT